MSNRSGYDVVSLRVILTQAAVDLDKLIRLWLDRRAAQEHRVDDRKQCDVEADPECQRGNGGGREARALHKLAHTVSEIAQQRVSLEPPSKMLRVVFGESS